MSSSVISVNGQAGPFQAVPQSTMMREYLSSAPATATERLVAGAGGVVHVVGTSPAPTPVAPGEALRLKAAYIDQLVKQTRKQQQQHQQQ